MPLSQQSEPYPPNTSQQGRLALCKVEFAGGRTGEPPAPRQDVFAIMTEFGWRASFDGRRCQGWLPEHLVPHVAALCLASEGDFIYGMKWQTPKEVPGRWAMITVSPPPWRTELSERSEGIDELLDSLTQSLGWSRPERGFYERSKDEFTIMGYIPEKDFQSVEHRAHSLGLLIHSFRTGC